MSINYHELRQNWKRNKLMEQEQEAFRQACIVLGCIALCVLILIIKAV